MEKKKDKNGGIQQDRGRVEQWDYHHLKEEKKLPRASVAGFYLKEAQSKYYCLKIVIKRNFKNKEISFIFSEYSIKIV